MGKCQVKMWWSLKQASPVDWETIFSLYYDAAKQPMIGWLWLVGFVAHLKGCSDLSGCINWTDQTVLWERVHRCVAHTTVRRTRGIKIREFYPTSTQMGANMEHQFGGTGFSFLVLFFFELVCEIIRTQRVSLLAQEWDSKHVDHLKLQQKYQRFSNSSREVR